MERIRQAVEQARKQRQSSSFGAGTGMRSAAGFPAGGVSELSVEQPRAIEYTQTRSITVSHKVRARNRLVAGIDGHPLQDIYRMLRTRVLQESLCPTGRTQGCPLPQGRSSRSGRSQGPSLCPPGDSPHNSPLPGPRTPRNRRSPCGSGQGLYRTFSQYLRKPKIA